SSSSSSSSLLSEMLSRSRTRGGSPPPRDICRPTGQISDAHCDYETVESVLNSPNFFDTLDQLRKAPYFRYYKVDLYRDCPFWVENGLCMSKDCTVQKTDETEIPQEYRSAHLSLLSTTPDEEVHGGGGSMSSSLHAADPSHLMTDADASTCTCAETDFCHWEDEEWSPESQWVNLLENPERFTGYAGPSANRVWRAIYEENCFGVGTLSSSSSSSSSASSSSASSSSWLEPPREKGMGPGASGYLLGSLASPLVDASSEQCLEKRVFYRLISGLHASISIHICHDHLDQRTGKWAPNLECFISRIAHHAERLENVYFDYLVLVRALAKLTERLSPAEESQGQGQGHTTKATAATPAEMERALPLQLARGLPDSSMDESTPLLASLLAQASQSPPTFDEQAMFHSDEADDEDLRYEFRRRFRNVSQIMDCVGCDKCRLWGKLQVNGLGTALKILFGGRHAGLAEGARGTSNDGMLLQRSELVALINTVHRFGESLRAVETFREMYHDEVSRREREEE
ncbi:endoplasmic reticulum oxidoreductin 1, partial [Acaromyces ingoldii]